MHIGVFDSGIGGEAIAHALATTFPTATIRVVSDKSHMPYGDRTPDEITTLTDKAIQPLLAQSDIIVIACNTATTTALPTLRKKYPEQHFIGIEPMIKPAAASTKTGIIAVCATPTTLASARYNELKAKFAPHLTVIEPDCREWAFLIENNQINRSHIKKVVDTCRAAGADVIVLGCTHYHWIKDEIISEAGPEITVLEPSEAIGARIRSVLEQPARTDHHDQHNF